MNNKVFIWGFFLSVISTSCAPKLNVPSEYIISGVSLKDSLKQNDKNLVLFWTDWCGASKHRIERYYKPLSDKIKKDDLDLDLILLASDANITLEDMDKFRNLGISCYFIDRPGGNAILNRMSIKRFINNTFPDNQIDKLTKFQYGIPVELLITKNLEIINEKETKKSSEFIFEILNLANKN